MALVRWGPSEGLTSLRRGMDRLFDDFLTKGPFHTGDFGGQEPAVEVADTKDAVVVKAQVPGVSKENLHVNITDDSLTLKGEIKKKKKKRRTKTTKGCGTAQGWCLESDNSEE